jgi:hypothetical protein
VGEEAEALDQAMDAAETLRGRMARTCKHGLSEWDGPCFACANEPTAPRKAAMPAAKKPAKLTPPIGPIKLGRRNPLPGAAAAPAPVAQPSSPDVLVQGVIAKANLLRASITDHSTNLTPLPQHALAIAQALQLIKAEAEAALKVFTECAGGWKKVDESIEAGRFTVDINSTPRCSPAWKNEAVTQARKLAEVNGAAFNEAAYVETVQKAAGKTPVKTIRVVETET